jgi:hypothetical protein
MNNQLIDQIHALRAGLNALEVAAQEAKERERVHLALFDWLLTGGVGLSSEQIIREYLGLESPTIDYPLDYQDFKRCYQLVNAIPEMNSAVEKLAFKSEHWLAIAKNWPDIWSRRVNLGELLARVDADRKSRWERGLL